MKNNKNSAIPKSAIHQMKELVEKAKKQGKIKPHTQAFTDYPVENEIHKGNVDYFCK